MTRTLRTLIAALLLTPAAAAAPGTEVGRFALVQKDVTSLKPGAAAAVAALPGAPIVLAELEATGVASAAKMTFGAGALISIGQNTRFAVSQQALDEATGASTSTLELLSGKLRVFVSRFWSGRPEVSVKTPTAVAGIKGSEVVLDVRADGTTIVTVLSGEARVRDTSGTEHALRAGQQLSLSPGGAPGEPRSVGQDVLTALWLETEPDPTPPLDGTGAGLAPSGTGPGPLGAIYGSGGTPLLADPAANVSPDGLGPRGQIGSPGDNPGGP